MAISDQELIKLHSEGATQVRLAEAAGMTLSGVRKRIYRLGLRGHSVGTRNFEINDTVFDVIDTEEKAYWLGFLLADGCIGKSAGTRRSLHLSLQKRDEHQVKKLAKFLGFKGNFYTDNRDGHPRICMMFNSVRLCGVLCGHGWMEFKQDGDTRIMSIAPNHLQHHFVRGYYDGDGCISRRKSKRTSWYMCIVGPDKQPMQFIADVVKDHTGIDRQVMERNTIYCITWNGGQQLRKLTEWLYQDATVWLERKRARAVEMIGSKVFTWRQIHNFEFNIMTNDVIARIDRDQIIEELYQSIMTTPWHDPVYDIESDLEECRLIDKNNTNCQVGGRVPGWRLIAHFQPAVWQVAQNGHQPLALLHSRPSLVRRAVTAFLMTPDKSLTPARLIRELLFTGFTKASVLSVPILLAAIKHFGLTGSWFDPCAGWGNRLLAAKLLGLDYEATDPGVSFPGLLKIKEFVGSDCKLHNLPWQQVSWPQADFVLTSPPFHDKEDYLDGVDYGKFDDWYRDFLRPLVVKAKSQAKRVVLHVDAVMRAALAKDFQLNEVPITNKSRHKAPGEWFVEIL